jgi:hypothetical protein
MQKAELKRFKAEKKESDAKYEARIKTLEAELTQFKTDKEASDAKYEDQIKELKAELTKRKPAATAAAKPEAKQQQSAKEKTD